MTKPSIQRPELHISDHPNGYILGTAKNAMKTRGGVPVTVPTRALAEALKVEWDNSARDSPYYALTCFTLDAMVPNRAEREGELLGYLHTDTLRYHSPEEELRQRQQAEWEPRLQALEAAFGLLLPRTTGIWPLEPLTPAEEARIREFLASMDAFTLTGFYQSVQITHSFCLGRHLMRSNITSDESFALAYLEQHYQGERWGQDSEAEKTLRERCNMLKNIDSWFCALRER